MHHILIVNNSEGEVQDGGPTHEEGDESSEEDIQEKEVVDWRFVSSSIQIKYLTELGRNICCLADAGKSL